jgi:hypothetical protein
MRRALLGAVAAFGLAAVGFAGHANAQQQCWWNGFAWSCQSPAYSYSPGYYYGPYGYPSLNPYATGYKPDWLPSYPGPRPSSGAGR